MLLGYRNPFRRISHAGRVLTRRPRIPKHDRRCFRVGHRGPARFEAGNTMPSFAKADRLRDLVGLGVDGILTDDPARLRRIVSGR